VNWILKKSTVGTSADRPVSLRRKAQEFRRLAMASSDPTVIEELEVLVWRYLERAREMDATRPISPKKGARGVRA
jgi:hypothetical protein